MAEFNEVYQKALYYDIVFKRDVSHEVDFIISTYEQFCDKKPQSLLDLACGPGYHARNFASRGLRAIGLDIREEMLAFAQQEAQQENVSVDWIASDMRKLKLAEPVDIAVSVFDGIDCLLTNDDIIMHFQAIAENLTPNGLYFIDVTDPRIISFAKYPLFTYSGVRNGVQVEIFWNGDRSFFDVVAGVARTEVEMRVIDGQVATTFNDVAEERFLNAQEITLLARCSGVLKPVAWYGAYDHGQPLTGNSDSQRMIAVLQRM